MKKTALVFVLLLLAASAAIAAAGTPDPQNPTPRHFVGLRIGSWNVMLQPWLSYEDRVRTVLAQTNLDVLVLEEVWTEGARDRILAAVGQSYPYWYWSPAVQEPASYGLSPGAANDYISCLISTGTDTRTIEQPAAPIDPFCQFLGLNIALEDQTSFECLQSTMQTLPSGNPGAYNAVTLCEQQNGVKLSHQGNVGRLVLSKWPITNVVDVPFSTYAIRRVNTYATIKGVPFAFVHWPANVLFDVDPSLGPLQTGSLQTTLAQDVLVHAPQVVVGGFNSGPDYQPAGFTLLTQNGYQPQFSQPTYCTPALQGFPPCGDFNAIPASIDNILLLQNGGTCQKATFGGQDASDHIGLAVACVLTTP